MSIKDMTSEQIVAEIRYALERELQKKPLTSPTYHSGHVAIAYEVGKKDAEARIIKLLEAECDCAFFEKYQIPSKCDAHKHIALIKGETGLPDYHCPDCKDFSCSHCYCVGNTDCESCQQFIKGETK